MIRKVFVFFQPLLLPLLLTVYLPLFHYSNNATIILISSLTRLLFLYVLFMLGLYSFFFLAFRKTQGIGIANATFIFLICFNLYGILYKYVLEADVVQIEHFTLLPLAVLTAFYLSWAVTRLNKALSYVFWKNASLILSLLITFNALKIIPAEIQKINSHSVSTFTVQDEVVAAANNYPDIYYIVFDEFAGFESMKDYWNYQDVDTFRNFLIKNDFHVVDNSYGTSEVTLYELASRLNYQYYPCCDHHRTYFEAIANSQAAQYLKERGYTTIAFEELRTAFPADIPFQADYFYESDPNLPPVPTFLDEFGVLVIDNTMASAFSDYYKPHVVDPFLKNHRNMIYFTTEKIANLSEVPAPRFVYVHLLLPHVPFMFDANGNVIDQKYRNDWNYYLGNYIFTIRIAEKMVTNLLSQASPDRTPIIIIQSDHGARNQIIHDNQETLLQNYPEKYKRNILFALHIPGYDTSQIPDRVDPVNTFPIIFNYLFDAGIPLIK